MARRLKGRALIDQVLADLSDADWRLEEGVRDAFREHAPYAAPRLLEVACDPGAPAEARLNAALYLFWIGDAAFRDGIVLLMQESDPALRRRVLKELAAKLVVGRGEDERASASRLRALEPELRGWLEDADEAVRMAAVRLCAAAQVPGIAETLEAMLDTASLGVALSICLVLSEAGTSEKALERLLALLHDPVARDRERAVVLGLEKYLDSSVEELSRRAEAALRESYLEALPPPLGQQRLITFAEHSRPESVPVVEKMLAESRDPTVQGEALVALARHTGAEARPIVDKYLAEGPVSAYAAEALGIIEAGSEDPAVIDTLCEVADRCYASLFEKIPKAILRVGGELAHRAAKELVDRKAPHVWLDLLGDVHGENVESVIRGAIECGVLDGPPPADFYRKARDLCGPGASLSEVVATVLDLSGILCSFDLESDVVPPPHDELVERFGRASRGIFTPENVVQVSNGESEDNEEAGYTISFTFGGRRQSFEAENLRDYYDAVSVAKAVNGALAAAGVTERFVGVGESYLFGDPERVKAFARRFKLALEHQSAWLPGE